MFDTDPTGWRLTTWWLYLFGAWYLLNFFWYWGRFRVAENRARAGGPSEAALYNRLLRGFPNAVYAKMFGKKPFETKADDSRA